MARQRLGVVLTVPEPYATQIDGIRRALGDGALGRIVPHITLVPPVNVADRDLPDAFAVVRAAAAEVPPLRLRLGPVATFRPVNPVAYLAVAGDASDLAALHRLRDGCLSGPLRREIDHDFVPHVTVADELGDARLDSVAAVLADFDVEVTVEQVHVLAQQAERRWTPIAEARLGEGPATVGRGGLPLELAVSGRPDLEAASLLAIDGDAPGVPFAVTARRAGAVVGAAWGWTAANRLELADLVVAAAHRGEGVGRQVLLAVEGLGRRRACRVGGTSAPSSGAAASLLAGCGWTVQPSVTTGGARARWERWLDGSEVDA